MIFKKIFQKKFLDYFLVFLAVALLTSNTLINACLLYSANTFDSLNLIVWEYAAKIGLLPYKDLFYPYGFLSYFRFANSMNSFFVFLLSPILIIIFLFIFKKIYSNTFYAYISLVALFLFVYFITGFETFDRYGVLTGLVGVFCCYLYTYKIKIPKIIIFIFGITIGLLTLLIIDQSIYSMGLFIALLFTHFLLQYKRKNTKESVKRFGTSLITLLIAFGIGFLPFFIFLWKTNSLLRFIQFFSYLSDISLFAKTPFIHSLFSTDNIFLLLIGVMAIGYISYTCINNRDRLTVNHYYLIGLMYVFLLLEQKSVIRSIASEITFIGVLLFISLFYEFFLFLKKHKINTVSLYLYYLNFVIAFIFIIGFTSYSTNPFYYWTNSSDCNQENMQKQLSQDQTYSLIRKYISSGNIFSYPGTPLFYMLFHQQPPYYLTIYEGSPRYAQKKMIQYIQDQHIMWVIYDDVDTSIQDGVPDTIRAADLDQFILNNFSLQKNIGRFLILKRNLTKKDFFKNPKLFRFPLLKQELVDIDLESIPRSEGYYKSSLLEKRDTFFDNVPINVLNKNLREKNITSDNKVLVITIKKTDQKILKLTIRTKDGLKTDVQYLPCLTNNPCIIDLSRLPVFYQSRQLQSITDENNIITGVSLYNFTNPSLFW